MDKDQEQFDILVVDDNRNNLRLLTDILVDQGYRVRPVPGGKMALSSAMAKRPDLILLDIMMPEMDGYAVCAKLKEDEHLRNIPVIFISALNETLDKVKAFEAGCVDYITKPFQDAEVKVRVQTHLSLRNIQKLMEKKNRRLQDEIQEREKTEKSLRQIKSILERTNDILRNILATSPIGICLLEDNRFKWANAAMIKMFGFKSEKEFRGKPLSFIYSSKTAYEAAKRVLQDSLETGTTASVDSRFQKKGGDTFAGHLKMRFSHPSIPVKRAIITLSDESWRIKAAEEKLYREKLQGVLEMAGAVCHELNQPLQAITGYAEILHRDLSKDSRLSDKIGKVLDQTRKMGEMTQKLMRISTYETKAYIEGVRIIDIDKSASENDPW